jgi:predicted ATP-dependent endonuclease of OLD family
MKYRDSQLDKSLRQWFANDFSKQLLRRIRIQSGNIRGLSLLDVDIDYPIIAFAGVNGSGKSTILALACCAYHNFEGAFKLPKRKNAYYTFSDFFLQHTEEVAPQGIEIKYEFAIDNLKKSDRHPGGRGIGYQLRKKKQGGKWNNYDDRLHKTVVFLGIERIVPHAERSQSRSYSKSFKNVKLNGWETQVKDAVGFILGKSYDDFRHLEHTKYSLPIVKVGGLTYSGFNMGAGENALFEIFSTIYACGQNSLLVLDEIELGLHAKAQRLFMQKLKEVCKNTGTQVICTTHSKEIFDCLPDDARFFIESVGNKTKITAGISSEFAFSKLGATGHKELNLFVEDQVAKALIQAFLPSNVRSRITITIIGSASAISKQLAALFVRNGDTPTLAVYDGDQKSKQKYNVNLAVKMSEKTAEEITPWLIDNISYIPGETWPEAWIIQKSKGAPDKVAVALGLEVDRVLEVLEYGLQAGKHNEFNEISQHVGLDRNQCLQHLCSVVCNSFPEEFVDIKTKIFSKLA